MEFIENEVYHIYNRGNNQQKIFFKRDNYLFFLKKVVKELSPYCDLIAYCLMPNHFHLIVYIKPGYTHRMTLSHPVSNAIAILLRSYTRAIQKQEGFTGSLFQQKTKAKPLADTKINYTVNYLEICIDYIHHNPLRAKLVKHSADWEFSSYREYLNIQANSLCNKKLMYSLIGITEEDSSDDLKSSDE